MTLNYGLAVLSVFFTRKPATFLCVVNGVASVPEERQGRSFFAFWFVLFFGFVCAHVSYSFYIDLPLPSGPGNIEQQTLTTGDRV